MLDLLIDELGKDDYAALLIAGDVYDRSIPSPDAVELLGSFLAKVRRRFPDLAVIIGCGNHDSPERLGYGDKLFSSLGIHIISDPEHSFEPIIVEKNGERSAIFVLPFLTPGSLRDAEADKEEGGRPLRSQKELALAAAARLEIARTRAIAEGALSTILVAHLFAAGGRESESERSFLGTAERVDAELFKSFDYVALGHLHRFQKAGKSTYYSGSPLAYSFDEADHQKCLVAVDVRPNTVVEISRIPTRPTRRVTRLSGTFDSFMAVNAYLKEKEDYLEIALTDGQLVENPLALLRTRYPNLLSVRQDTALAAVGALELDGRASVQANRGRNVADDFSEFLSALYGQSDEKKMDLFKKIAAEVDDATT